MIDYPLSGLKFPKKQHPRGRLWLNDGSCVRLRPERPGHVWSYDFVATQTHDGRSIRLLTLIDEFSREWALIGGEVLTRQSKVFSSIWQDRQLVLNVI